jgi:hypothetical protein
VRIKTCPNYGAEIANITYEDLFLTGVVNAVYVISENLNYPRKFYFIFRLIQIMNVTEIAAKPLF